MSMVKNIGAYLLARNNIAQNAGTTAGTTVNGAWFDTRTITGHYESCKAVIPFSYIKTTAAVITVSGNVQHSSAGSTVGSATLATGAVTTIAAGTGTAATAATVSQAHVDVDLTIAKRYLRIAIAPKNTVVSTASVLNSQAMFIFGGSDVNPAA